MVIIVVANTSLSVGDIQLSPTSQQLNVNGGAKMVVRRRDSNLVEIKDKHYSIALGCREEGG